MKDLGVANGLNTKCSPYFSIVLSVYNIKEYLERCVKSIKKQTFSDYEVIFVDDGSTDGSEHLCDAFARLFGTAKVIHKENGGLSSARNAGLQVAEGTYTFFLDPDDWIDERLLETIYKRSKVEQYDVFKYGYRRLQDGKCLVTRIPCFNEGLYKKSEIREIILPRTICNEYLFDYETIAINSAWASIYRTDFLKKNRIQFESERIILNEDFLFNLMVMIKANTVFVLHAVLYNYDYRINSLSKRYINDMLNRKRTLFDRFKTYLEEAGLFDQYRKYYYGFCLDGFYATITNECSVFSEKEKKKTIKSVKEIIGSDDCKKAIKECSQIKMHLKGRIIYLLMRARAARSIVNLYSVIKRSKGIDK